MITPERASAIAHGDLRIHNPIGEATVDRVVGLLPLGPDDRALDVGCGRGELLLRIAERTGAAGVGVDTSAEQIATARAEAAARLPGARLRFEVRDAADLDAPPESFALAACVGSTHALGGLDTTLARLAQLVRPGGLVLVGEGYWARPPSPELLETLGATADELAGYEGLLDAGGRHGLVPVYVARTSDGEWDAYEWAYVYNAERYASDHPEEDGVDLLRARAESTRRRRLLAATRGEELGFALVLWRVG